MSKKQAFTPAGIEAMRLGKMADPHTPGLFIEMLPSGKRVWKYRRRIAETEITLNERLGLYPGRTIASARTWAQGLNKQVERGIDPREGERARERATGLTVEACHAHYIAAVKAGEHRTRKRKSAKPISERTIKDKEAIYRRNVATKIGSKLIGEVTEADIDAIIMGMKAKVQANRTGAELRVFFGWAGSRRGEALGIKLKADPTARVGELWHAEAPRERWLDDVELPLFLKAIAAEPKRNYRRAMLLLLLTGCRRSELFQAPTDEVREGKWIIPGARTKNGVEHPITLAPWSAHLIAGNEPWIIASTKYADKRMHDDTVTKVMDRARARMIKASGREIEDFTAHDLRRTMRSHLEDHGIDETLAERMINHKLTGLREVYNRNKRAAAMAGGFLAWDQALAAMAIKAGVGEALEVVTIEAVTEATPQLQTA